MIKFYNHFLKPKNFKTILKKAYANFRIILKPKNFKTILKKAYAILELFF